MGDSSTHQKKKGMTMEQPKRFHMAVYTLFQNGEKYNVLLSHC